jgi:hypothetical protein
MEDEKYVYYQDLNEKKSTGHSARKQRTHCGKGGRVKFPSDYLTKKEIKNMSGECKSYRLNEPMTFEEWKAMPDDIKIMYINALREKYNAPNVAICQMMGCTKDALYFQLKRLDLAHGTRGAKLWDKEGFFNWWKGIPTKEEPVEAVEEEVIEEETHVTEECPYKQIPNPGIKVNLINAEEELKKESEIRFKKAIPTTGSMTYEGMTFDILSSISDLLGNANVLLSVKWDVVED